MAAIGTVLNAGKAILDAAKTNNEASAESSATVDVNPFEETPMEIKRTEGDLGYDEEEKEEETPQEHIDEDPTANPMDVKEVADVEETERPDSVLPTANDTENEADDVNPFNQQSDVASTSNETDLSNLAEVGKNIVSAGIDSAHTADSGNSVGTVSGAPAIRSNETGESNPLQIPMTHSFSSMMESDSPETKSLLEQAEEAYSDDKDIDDKELPFVANEQAAEDVEDLITNEEIPEEEKEKILEQAVEEEKDGKLEENDLQDDIAEEAGESNEEAGESNEEPKEEKKGIAATINGKIEEAENKWKNSEAKKLLDKGVKLGSIIYGLMNPKSVSASSGETVAVNKYDDEKATTTSGGMGYDENSAVESTSSTGSAPAQGSISGTGNSSKKGESSTTVVNSKVPTKAGLSKMENSTSKSASSSSSSTKGSMVDTFNKIIAGGINSSKTGGDSKFVDSGIAGGKVGSAGGSASSGKLQISPEQQAKIDTVYDTIKQQVQAHYKQWDTKGDMHVKEKGSVSVRTENGKDIGVKLGTRRVMSLETLAQKAPEKLGLVEQVV
jgi:hypothetical protein